MQTENIVTKCIRTMNAYAERISQSEKYCGEILHTAEIHLIEAIGLHPNSRTTELAEILGLTKGRVSQLSKVLIAKKFIRPAAGRENKKEIFYSLTASGEKIFKEHAEKDAKIISPIIEHLKSLNSRELEVIEQFIDITYAQLSSE